MGGAPRYWNEEAQRWEEGGAGERGGTEDAAVPAAPPPPAVPPPPAAPPSGTPTLTSLQWSGGGTSPAAWTSPELPHTLGEEPVPPGHPAPARYGLDRRRLWAVTGGAAVVGVVVGLVLIQTLGGGEGAHGQGDGRAPSAGVSQSAGSGPGPGTSGPEEPPAPSRPPSSTDRSGPSAPDPDGTVPAGYDRYADSEGFTIVRPAGWVRSSVSSQYGMDVVNYRSPDGGRRLQVFEVAEPSPDASYELFLSDATPKAPGFEQLSLETLDDGDFTGSRLEYLADSFREEPDIGTWHVVDLRFQAADGKLYALAAYGADSDGHEDERELIRIALEHFCPPDTTCGTATSSG